MRQKLGKTRLTPQPALLHPQRTIKGKGGEAYSQSEQGGRFK